MFQSIFQLSRYDPGEVAILRRNLRVHIADGMLFGFASVFISVQTVLPVFIQQLGGGPVAVGSVAVLWTLGSNLPQVLFLPLTHRGGPMKPFMLRYALIQRLLYCVLGLVTLFIVGKMFVANTIVVMLSLLLLIATAGSIAGPPWLHLFTVTVPVPFRGRLLAVRQLFSALLGIVAGSMVTLILASLPFPTSFAALFFLAFGLSMMSYYYLTKMKEPEESIQEEMEFPLGALVQRGLFILRSNRNFRGYLLVDALSLITMTAPAFFAVYAMQKFSLPVSYAGAFTIITMASMVGANVVFGHLADHRGHRLNLILLSGSIAAACLTALIAPNVYIYGGVFFFMACAIALQGISRMQIVAEMAPAEDRPIYFALTNTVTAPTVFFGLLAGGLIKGYGYEGIFLLYALLAIFSVYWLIKKVVEPRTVFVEPEEEKMVTVQSTVRVQSTKFKVQG